jgi:hypothetical protein
MARRHPPSLPTRRPRWSKSVSSGCQSQHQYEPQAGPGAVSGEPREPLSATDSRPQTAQPSLGLRGARANAPVTPSQPGRWQRWPHPVSDLPRLSVMARRIAHHACPRQAQAGVRSGRFDSKDLVTVPSSRRDSRRPMKTRRFFSSPGLPMHPLAAVAAAACFAPQGGAIGHRFGRDLAEARGFAP